MISNWKVYGLEDSIKASKYPMAVDVEKCTSKVTPTVKSLAGCKPGTGHDNFLNGIVVQFDLTFTIKAWTEAERYHFFEFVSSQSTMHRITKFDLDKAYIEYVDPRMIAIMKELVDAYNADPTPDNYLILLYSNPVGFRLTARITTDYRQLKTIYHQRKNHRLPEWRAFCKWVESLPHSEFITEDGVKRGHWKPNSPGDVYACSECGYGMLVSYHFKDRQGIGHGGNNTNFCPNCGAKMSGGKDNEKAAD